MEKSLILEKRKEFFEDIVKNLSRDLGPFDKFWGHDKYYKPIDPKGVVMDAVNGELICEVKGDFHGKKFEFLHSIWQVGTILKIGFLLKTADCVPAFNLDEKSEILYVWGEKNAVKIKIVDSDYLFYDWEFDATNIYKNYQEQERFIFGIRHMHFRVLRIIHDECKKIKTIKQAEEKNDSLDEIFKLTD